MDKYTGCNVVESVVTRMPQIKVKRKRKWRGFFVRLAVAAAVVGAFCMFAYAPIPGMKAARSAAARVFCYDVFGRTGFGTSPVITKLLGA